MLDNNIVFKLKQMLDEFNNYAKAFRMARETFQEGPIQDLRLRLICDRQTDGRIYSLPCVFEVAALIVGDFDSGEKET